MFTNNQEEYLIRRLNRNDVVLFLGAGFSAGAVNSLDQNLPLGPKLTKLIYEFMYPDVPYVDDGTNLQEMYQALLKSGKTFSQIKDFLGTNLLVKSYPEYYKYLAIPFWYKIYTVNIDNLLNKIFNRFSGQLVQDVSFPFGEFKERDQLLESIQVNYLHGKLMCNPDEVIFSRTQYAKESIKLQPLYFHFVHDYSNQPTIFIGTALDEQLFYQYIATRDSIRNGTPENRPRSFLIVPNISPIREKNLKEEFNIEFIKGTAEDFLNWIKSKSSEILSKDELLTKLMPTFPKLTAHATYKDHFSRGVKEFSQAFQKVDLNKNFPQKKKRFLLGSTPTWADMHYELDAPREITKLILDDLDALFDDTDLHSAVILGTAGCGKSTVLKRVCCHLVNEGRSVYFSHSENLPSAGDFLDTLEMLNERVVIAIDNAELVLRELAEVMEVLSQIKFPPIFLLASRTNLFERISSKYKPLINLQEYEVENLTRGEIIGVIQKLDDNNLLGHLKGKRDDERIREFEFRAKKQILVAMREATEGRDFDVIMKSEFEEIPTDEAKMLCLCVSLTTEAGFTISRQDFTSFSVKPSAEALDILERTLKDIVVKVGVKDEKLLLRHRMIANYLIENCAQPEVLKQTYIRVLSSLANEINSSNRLSRKFNLYKEIINHYMVYRRFEKNIDKAREVFESLVDYFKNDHQFWLQYGSLELEGAGGDLELAENYLNQARSIKEGSVIVKNALASLYYKKALYVSNKIEADILKEKADSILLELLRDSYKRDPYTYHIFGKGYYNWIIQWLRGPENIKAALQPLYKLLNEGSELYPGNKKIRELKETIQKAILLTAVNEVDGQPSFPVLYSEFDKDKK